MEEILESLTIFLLLEAGVIYIMIRKEKFSIFWYYLFEIILFLVVGFAIASYPEINPPEYRGYLLTILATGLGVNLGFLADRILEKEKKKALTIKILTSVKLDLEANKMILEESLKKDMLPNYSLASWRIWENRIELDDIYLQTKISNLFDHLQNNNDTRYKDSLNYKSMVSRLKEDYSGIKKELQEVLNEVDKLLYKELSNQSNQ